MTPIVNGQYAEFAARGLYNGLVLLGDKATNSYWDHITGECVHGTMKGAQLDFTEFDLVYTSVEAALNAMPHAHIAISDQLTLKGRFMKWFTPLAHKVLGDRLPPHFVRTVGAADDRRTRMDLGLGIWSGKNGRYYPLERIKAAENGLLDDFDGVRFFIYYSDVAKAPDVFAIDANNVRRDGEAYCFDNGMMLHAGVLMTERSETITPQRPQQMFTRWYGFSYTFPNCEIYGD